MCSDETSSERAVDVCVREREGLDDSIVIRGAVLSMVKSEAGEKKRKRRGREERRR